MTVRVIKQTRNVRRIEQTRDVSTFRQGPQGEPGAPGASAYAHDQPIASSTWTINHNLGYRPSVEVFDAGSVEVIAAISHPTVNQAVVSFNIPTAGFARLT